MLPEDIIKHPLTNVPEFVDLMIQFGDERIYRGQTDSSWPLKPKAGREEFLRPPRHHAGKTLHPDLLDFEEWRRSAVAFCDSLPERKLESLAFAQHYGLATRLLDWTENPLVALFFAVESRPDNEGIIYCYNPSQWEMPENFDPVNDDPGIYKNCLYRPRPFDRRIHAQQGVFTYHSHPTAEFKVSDPLAPVPVDETQADLPPWMTPLRNLTAFPIPSQHKQTMMIQLKRLGVTRKALFPDLEGLSSYINWEARREVQK